MSKNELRQFLEPINEVERVMIIDVSIYVFIYVWSVIA